MPHLDGRSRHRHSVTHDRIYIIVLYPIPRNFGWQEIKDIARSYGVEHVRKADTVDPSHTFGSLEITGLEDADKAFEQFKTRGFGVRGPEIRVALHGPYRREEIGLNLDLSKNCIKRTHTPDDTMIPRSQTANPSTTVSRHSTELVSQHRRHAPSFSVPVMPNPRLARTPAPHLHQVVSGNQPALNSRQHSHQQMTANADLSIGRRLVETRPPNPHEQRQQRSTTTSQGRGRFSRAVRITYLPISYAKRDVNTLLLKVGRIEADSLSFDIIAGIGVAQAVFKSSGDSSKAIELLNDRLIGHNQLSVTYDAAYEANFKSPSSSEDGDGSSEQERPRPRRSHGPVAYNGAIGSRNRGASEEDENVDSSDGEQSSRHRSRDVRTRHMDKSKVH